MRWIILALILSSCGAANQLKRAERLIAKAEAKGAKWSVDTVYVTKEVIVPEVKFDTVIQKVNFTDTLTIVKDNIVTKVKVNTITKEIFVSTKCPPDTIRIEVPVRIDKSIKAGYTLLQLIGMMVFGIVLGALLGKLLWK